MHSPPPASQLPAARKCAIITPAGGSGGMADTSDLKSDDFGRAGSSPAYRTKGQTLRMASAFCVMGSIESLCPKHRRYCSKPKIIRNEMKRECSFLAAQERTKEGSVEGVWYGLRERGLYRLRGVFTT